MTTECLKLRLNSTKAYFYGDEVDPDVLNRDGYWTEFDNTCELCNGFKARLDFTVSNGVVIDVDSQESGMCLKSN